MYLKFCTFMLLITITIVGCNSNSDDNPAKAAEIWLEAMLDSDGTTIARYTCLQSQAGISESSMMMSLLNAFGGGSVSDSSSGLGFNFNISIDYDLDDLDYDVVQENENTAQVRVHGAVTVAVLGLFQSTPIDDIVFMRREDGRWKFCTN